MNAVRSCLAAALLLATVYSLAAADAAAAVDAARVCCAGTGGDAVPCPAIGNLTYGAVETYGDRPSCNGTADVNETAAAAVGVWKCCQPDMGYDPDARVCRPAGPDAVPFWRLLRLALDRCRSAPAVGYTYKLPKCDNASVLVDVPADQAAGAEAADPGYCLDATPSSRGGADRRLVARACRPRDHHCRGRNTCVNKCCSIGKTIVNGTCKSTNVPLSIPVYELPDDGDPVLSNNTVLPYYDRLPCRNRYKLPGRFRVLANGSIRHETETDEYESFTVYCLEFESTDTGANPNPTLTPVLAAFACPVPYQGTADDHWGSLKYVMVLICIVPSIVCLTITLVVYATLPNLRNVHGYYVMCYVACLLAAFVGLLIIQWAPQFLDDSMCKFFGYFTQFAFLTTFCWLNVICFDIYWMLRYNTSINKSTSISIRTIVYNVYCWGFSTICTITGFLFQYSQRKTLKQFAPDIGNNSCWFSKRNNGLRIFYILPVSIMLVSNLILFVLTSFHCSRIKSELNNFKRSDTKTQRFHLEKEKFVMSTKLFLVMGIPWIFEMLSSIFDNDWFIWHIPDQINALQGVLIFLIFVAKRKVMISLRKKINNTLDNSESTKVYTNTTSGSSQSGSAHRNFNDF